MTNEPKSCAQINAEVALHLEWTCVNGWWFPSKGDTRHSGKPYLPDSCGEWVHAGPLLEKLIRECCVGVDSNDAGQMCVSFPFKPQYLTLPGSGNYWADTLTEAITRAFHAAFVEEGE